MIRRLLEMLYTGGLRVDTHDAQGNLRLSSVVQLDGDTVLRVDPAAAADPALVERHAEQLRTALRPLRWMGRSADVLALIAALTVGSSALLASREELVALLLTVLALPVARAGSRLLLKGLLALGRRWVTARAHHYFGAGDGKGTA